ncbi:MAG: hypothetical protein BJ554DRAFT_8134 [Olpidium bornovanus]|uniref:Uncharacterized protein n=1 Tax=Olpidium bornovanus TaxID=278681 RepID=A0A8H8DM41_9FUNG|nr:MAG: hypothetical protein BJ554DRAFT_8134 [Olpidium bornovanus]
MCRVTSVSLQHLLHLGELHSLRYSTPGSPLYSKEHHRSRLSNLITIYIGER